MNALVTKVVVGLASLGFAASPVMAQSADGLQDLLGQKQTDADAALKSRGFEAGQANARSKDEGYYWWNPESKKCVRVTMSDGRYSTITSVKNKDCGYSNNGDALAVAAVLGATALGALLLSKKNKDKPDQYGQDSSAFGQQLQQLQVYGVRNNGLSVFSQPVASAPVLMQMADGAVVQGYGCQVFNREQWCEVSPNRSMAKGWALGRYLRAIGSIPLSNQASANGADGELVRVTASSAGYLNLTAGPSDRDYVVGRVDAGSTLRRYSCHNSNREVWCQVATLDRRLNGWARDRFLQPITSSGSYPNYDASSGSIAGLVGMESVKAFNAMRLRGFDNVDSFSSGRTVYSIYFDRQSGLCAQTAAERGKIVDVRDIRSHPKCR
jgi:uncharacterized protein YraI